MIHFLVGPGKCSGVNSVAQPAKGAGAQQHHVAPKMVRDLGRGVDAVHRCDSAMNGVMLTRWWFRTFFIFTPIWGRFPF